MKAKVYEIINAIESHFAYEKAETWDNVGLIIGSKDKTINSVFLSLDLTKNTLQKAIENKADLIITHHPPIFNPLKKINDELLLDLIKADICVYSAHTNLDKAKSGVNKVLADIFCLQEQKTLLDKNGEIDFVISGKISPTPLKEFAMQVKNNLKAPFVKVYPNGKEIISKVAVCSGGGDFMFKKAENICDVFVSSEFKHSNIINSKIALIDAGHFYTEVPIMQKIYDFLLSLNLKVFLLKNEEHEISKMYIL